MKKRHAKGRLRSWLFKAALLFFSLAGMGLIIYTWLLSGQVENRFAHRRWHIPSRVYSDTTLLFPGQRINPDLFQEKLRHLGYRTVTRRPQHKGELRLSTHSIELFLYDFTMPSGKREGFPLQISIRRDQIESIRRRDTEQAMVLLELEPEEIMLFFGPEREQRHLVAIDQVPEHFIQAILAAEDRRFFQHHGLDPRGILRAIYTNLRHGDIRQGGSTITQQLAKNYFLSPERTFSRKFKELLLSLILEATYDKNEILEIYLNEIYLGQKGSISISGVGEAAHFYFGKPVDALTVAESAVIAGLIRGPNYYSPYADRDRSQKRRDAVLDAMQAEGWISETELKSALQTPVKPAGYTAYGKKAPYFIDYLSSQLLTLYPQEMLSSLGLSIYTTLDTQVQMAAENALAKGLARLERTHPDLARPEPSRKLQGAVIVMQPKTGSILAMVGGRDYGHSQFNRITQAHRQPGSTFKPFVYLSALDKFTPVFMVSNAPQSYRVDGKTWQPQNFEAESDPGPVSLRKALSRSLNRATVDLALKVGLDHIIETAEAFQFSTPLAPYPSLALGSVEMIPLELARAYCALAADGVLPYPLSLKDVVDEEGNVIERRHMTIESVTSPQKAFVISSMLRSVVEEGTARSLKHMGITFPVAGKTGTTNDYKDAWFVGYTPDILALVWVGFDDGRSIHSTGSAAALPIWADLVKAIPQNISGDWFRQPAGVVKLAVCADTGCIAVAGVCPVPVEEYFLENQVPRENCPLHRSPDPFKQMFKGVKNFFKNL